MFILNGKPLSPDSSFTHNGVRYPANWLRLTSLEEKVAIGITEVPDPTPVDTRFYWDHDLPKQLEDETITPEEGEPYVQVGLKTQWKQQQDQTAYTLLAPTDWYVVRNVETGDEIPVGISSFRAEVRTVCENRKNAIGLATDVPSLIQILTFSDLNWPNINT